MDANGSPGIVNLTAEGRNETASHNPLCTHRFLPNLKGLGAQNPIVDRLQEVPADTKKILSESMECQESLRLSRGVEPSHRSFSLARRFVRDFGSVIRIDVVDVIYRGHDRTMSRIITSEFVGHQPPRFSPLAFDETAEKPFGRTLIATVLHENINAIAVLIDGTPQIVPFPLDGHKDFVDVPGIP